MMTKKDIFNMVTHVTKRSHNLKVRKLIDPRREWSLGLFCFVILLIIGLIYNAHNFSYYNNIEKHLTEGDSTVVNYNHGTMGVVLDYYDRREAKFNEIRLGIRAQTPPEVVIIEVEEEVIDEAATSSTETILETPVGDETIVNDIEETESIEPTEDAEEVPSLLVE
jgi:hypothetical protein